VRKSIYRQLSAITWAKLVISSLMNVGKVFVCKDGPVFTFAQIKDLPPEY
jgi:hypothetical protein